MKYLSMTQAAELLGVSRQRVHQMVQEGKLKCEKIGNQLVFKERDVLKLKK